MTTEEFKTLKKGDKVKCRVVNKDRCYAEYPKKDEVYTLVSTPNCYEYDTPNWFIVDTPRTRSQGFLADDFDIVYREILGGELV